MAHSPLHPKRAGSSVEAAVINREPQLQTVHDSEAQWHDARTTGVLTPSQDRPFGGVCVVERDTPVEIKSVVPEHSNGRSGQFLVKRCSHDPLVDAGGVYYLVIYAPRPETPVIAARVVPATAVDEALEDYWYDNGRRTVAKLSWPRIIDESRVYEGESR